MNIKKLFFPALILIGTASISFAQKRFTEPEQAVIDDFWNLRMVITCLDEKQEAVQAIDSYKEKNREQVEQLGEDALLLLDSLIMMERYNYLYAFPGENKETRKQFYQMRTKLRNFMENKTEKQINPYLYLCYADITSYYMAYSIKDIILHGMTVKRYQEKAIKACSEFSPAMVNLAQWYYYSPKIFGGSKEKTREWQIKSIQHARNNAELFFAKTAYSQFLFEMKEIEESQKVIEECAELCPGSNFIKLLQEQNALGNSLNDYNSKRSKLLKSADDYRKKNNMNE